MHFLTLIVCLRSDWSPQNVYPSRLSERYTEAPGRLHGMGENKK